MSRRAIARYTLVAAATALAVSAVAAVTAQLRGSSPQLPRVDRVEARPTLAGGEHRFGDLIDGQLDILVPLAAVDPSTVSATVDVAPYRLVGRVRIERLRTANTGRVRYRFAIDCLDSDACVPRQDRVGFTFAESRIHYRTRAGAPRSLAISWPLLHVRPRPRRDIFTPWEDGLRPLQPPGYRVSPHLVAALAVLLAFLAFAGSAALLRPLVRLPGALRRQQASALERALAIVRVSAARRDIDERRRALDLLSRAVRTVPGRRGAEARRLAWSQAMPHGKEMNELADRVERE